MSPNPGWWEHEPPVKERTINKDLKVTPNLSLPPENIEIKGLSAEIDPNNEVGKEVDKVNKKVKSKKKFGEIKYSEEIK